MEVVNTSTEMKFTLIRHAPTASNMQGYFMGSDDISITLVGEQESLDLSYKFQEIEISKVYTSPMKRAIETAKRVFPELGLVIDERLRERSLGEWEKKSKGLMKKEMPSAFLASGKLDPFFNPPGAEDIGQMVKRINSFLEIEIWSSLCSESCSSHVAVVSHSGVIRTLRFLLEEGEIYKIFGENESHLSPRTYNLSSDSKKYAKMKAAKFLHCTFE